MCIFNDHQFNVHYTLLWLWEENAKKAPAGEKRWQVASAGCSLPVAWLNVRNKRWHSESSYAYTTTYTYGKSQSSTTRDNWKYKFWSWKCAKIPETPNFHTYGSSWATRFFLFSAFIFQWVVLYHGYYKLEVIITILLNRSM